MVEPVRPQNVERLADRVRAGPLPGVHGGPEPERPRPQVDAGERRGRSRGLVAAHPEADDAGKRMPLVEIEDALGGLRAPVAHGVEKDPAVGDLRRRSALGESRVDGRQARGGSRPIRVQISGET